MPGAKRGDRSVPLVVDSRVFFGSDICLMQARKNFCGGIVVKTQVNTAEVLVNHRSAQKSGGGRFLGGIAGNGEKFSASGKNGAGNFALKRLEECDFALNEINVDGVVAQIKIPNGINLVGIYAKSVQRIIHRVSRRRLLAGRGLSGHTGRSSGERDEESDPEKIFHVVPL